MIFLIFSVLDLLVLLHLEYEIPNEGITGVEEENIGTRLITLFNKFFNYLQISAFVHFYISFENFNVD